MQEQEQEQKPASKSKTAPLSLHSFIIPLSIIAAGAIVAGAVYFSAGQRVVSPVVAGDEEENILLPQEELSSLNNMAPISAEDHIFGSADAPVKIVEYSDFECPFCKQFHATLRRVINEYGDSGEVAWVYRHSPLDQLHPIKARKEALATECAAEQGGEDMFWKFSDRLFELTLSNNRTDVDAVLPRISRELGLNQGEFDACVESEKYADRIDRDIEDAIATGGGGTPWSIVVAKNGEKYPLSGAQPYASVKQLIELALQEK